jgi:hypothetical protein
MRKVGATSVDEGAAAALMRREGGYRAYPMDYRGKNGQYETHDPVPSVFSRVAEGGT